MRINDIIRTIQDNFLMAIILVFLFGLLSFLGYFIIYKKILNGNRNLKSRKMLIGLTLIAYIIMVVGVTFLDRTTGMVRVKNLHFLSSYREAWNSFIPRTWRFIILNILMFIPLGVLLPLLDNKFRKFKWTFVVALLATLIIETLQFLTGFGIFDSDDLFNNVLGAVIGYGFVMIAFTLLKKEKNKGKKTIIYALPLITVLLVSFIINHVYHSKEFGNLPIAYNQRVNMRNIDLTLDDKINLKSEDVLLNTKKYPVSSVPIYMTQIYNQNDGENFFKDFINHEGSNEEIVSDSYEEFVMYSLENQTSYHMSFYLKGGTYKFTDFSMFNEENQPSETSKETVLKKLEEFEIAVPEMAVFDNHENSDEIGLFSWALKNHISEDYIIDGHLSVKYYNDNSLKEINNNLIKYSKIKNIPIISKEEAFKNFEKGKFHLEDASNISKIEVKEINLSYAIDTKGFYQPIYSFSLDIDGTNQSISIPAL